MKFYTSTTNSRGTPVTAGSHRGQSTHTRTWTHGVRIVSHIDETGAEAFHIYATGGSNGADSDFPIGVVRLGKKGPQFKATKKIKVTP